MTHKQQVTVWGSLNRGILTAIAKELGFKRVYVREVALKQKPSKDNRVERTLARYGCPGFEEFLTEESDQQSAGTAA